MADNQDRQKPGGSGNKPGGRSGRTPVTIDLPAQRVSDAKAGTAAPGASAKPSTPPAETGPAAEIKPSDTIAPKPDVNAGASAASVTRSSAEVGKRTNADAIPPRGGPMSGEPAAGAVRASPPPESGPAEKTAAAATAAAARTPPRAPVHPAEPTPAADRRGGVGMGTVIGIALVAAVLALAVFYGLQAAGVLPAPGNGASQEELQALRQEVESLRAEAGRAPPAPDLSPIEARIAAVEAGSPDVAALQEQVAALGSRLDGLPPPADPAAAGRVDQLATAVAGLRQQIAAQSAAGNPEEAQQFAQALGGIETRLGELEASRVPAETTEQIGALTENSTALRAEVSDLQERVGAIAAQVDQLVAAAPAQQESQNTARALAIGSLRSAADRGEPFAAEVAMLRQLGTDPESLVPLETVATGVPTRAALAQQFPAVANAILEATEGVDPNAGFFARLWGNASSLVTVRPVGPVEGTDPPAVVSRMQAAVSEGDLVKALAERHGLPEAGKAASAEWADVAARRVALDRDIATLAERITPAAAPAAAGGEAPAQ